MKLRYPKAFFRCALGFNKDGTGNTILDNTGAVILSLIHTTSNSFGINGYLAS
jgi:hypothetical protein